MNRIPVGRSVSDIRPELASIGDLGHEGFLSTVVASEFFTKGSCHQLALALVSVIEGAAFVALYDHADDDGRETDIPRLIHAAALVGDDILDVEDFVNREVWIERWSDQARDPNFVQYDTGELPFEYITPIHQSFSETVAARLVDYWENDIKNAFSVSQSTFPAP